MKNTINLNEGLDWSKVPCALETLAGVVHLPEGYKKEDCIIVGQQWRPSGYSIYNGGEYLGIKIFRASSVDYDSAFSRVARYKATSPDRCRLNASGSCSWRRDTEYGYISDSEFRIYKDRSCVAVNAVDCGEGEEKQRKFYVVKNHTPKLNSWDAFVSIRTGLPKPGCENDIAFVENDEQIKALATHLKTSDVTRALSGFDYLVSSDLSRRVVFSDTLRYRNTSFSEETRKVVNSFLQTGDPENKMLRYMFCRKNRIIAPELEVTLSSLRDLFLWISFVIPVEKPVSKKAAHSEKETKEEHAARLATLFAKEWDEKDSEKYANHRFWAREGDEIVLVLPSSSNGMGSWWRGDNGKKKIFSFNVKTRKRFMAEYDPAGLWEFPVPSMNYITTKLALGSGESTGKRPLTTVIKDGLTPRKLFDGTNIAWILDNVSRDVKTFAQRDDASHRTTSDKLVSVYKELSEKNIGILALEILTSTGKPVMEQLLKARLFNLYFCMLEDIMNDRIGGYICDLDKKQSSPRRDSSLGYHSKQKNLKKMFGLRMEQLRTLDDEAALCERSFASRYNGTTKYYERQLPKLMDLEKALGVPLCDVDENTFTRFVKLSVGKTPVDWGGVGEAFSDAIKDTGKNRVKQILSLCETYASAPDPEIRYGYRNAGMETYADYLRSRSSLKRTQEALKAAGAEGTEEIFSEKRYPIRPEKARRFIPFLEGLRDRRYPWRRETLTHTTFLTMYREKYKDAYRRGDVDEQWTLGEDGVTNRLAGILIHMTPRENVQFLHDDAAYWVGFYKDEGQNALFEEAVKRVQPLEWADSKSGLQIVAPKDVHELKEEGATLHHCVGGYVDAIIGGKDNIMFLRRSDMPNHPFFTVEIVHDGEIRQVHCYANLNPNEEDIKRAYEISGYDVYNKTFDIQGFLKKWAAAMKGKVDARSIQPRYHALCALR